MPRFLLGVALLWWGWRSGNYLSGALLAVLAEAPRMLRARYELGDEDFRRIATLCTIIFVALLAWLFASAEGPRTAYAVLTTLLWLPAVLMPLLLAQLLSSAGRVPLSAMFRYVRKLKQRNPATFDPPVDLLPIYFAIVLVASSIPNQRDAFFYAGAVLLVGWALATQRAAHVSPGAWLASLAIAAAAGFAAHSGLNDAQTWLEDWISERLLRGMAGDPYRSTTDLGSVGKLKMIDSIVLRVYASDADAPHFRLLHRASFTSLVGNTWLARNAPLASLQPQEDGTTWRLAEGPAQRTVRIVTRLERGKALLALPPGTLRIADMAAATVRHNALGAIEAELGGDWAPYVAEAGTPVEGYAMPRLEDLQIPERERLEFDSLARELGLAGLPAAAIAGRVQHHFASFAYATYRDSAVPAGATALGDFVRRSKSGHCEYFAAATTLLLRAAGVPARYATGFAVYEYSKLEAAYVVRARHAHAWTRAYVDGSWVDLDTTPPSWAAAEDERAPLWERFADFVRWAGFRWSQRGPLELGAGMVGLLCVLLGVFAWRLTRVKRATAPATGSALPRARRGDDSDIYELERALARKYGARASGEPLAAWTRRLARALNPSTREALGDAVTLHYRYRFDPAGIDTSTRQALRSKCKAIALNLD
jgi:transglutaminase-like putative cysteine protease